MITEILYFTALSIVTGCCVFLPIPALTVDAPEDCGLAEENTTDQTPEPVKDILI